MKMNKGGWLNMNEINKRIRIGKTEYYVVEETKDEVCILQVFDFADGIRRQLKIWTTKNKEEKE